MATGRVCQEEPFPGHSGEVDKTIVTLTGIAMAEADTTQRRMATRSAMTVPWPGPDMLPLHSDTLGAIGEDAKDRC